jgi:CheY-like chemotaxis protein
MATHLHVRRQRLPRPRVLLAEDDPAFRRLIAGMLRRDGFEVVEVGDGRQLLQTVAGVTQLATNGFDLVISDIRMPVMTGLDALAGLRHADWAVPVILITAFGDDDAREQATRLGAGAFFSKPFELAELRAAALALAGA